MPKMHAAEALPNPAPEHAPEEAQLESNELTEISEGQARAIEASKVKKKRASSRTKKAAVPPIPPNLNEKDFTEITETEGREIEASKLKSEDLVEIEEGEAEWTEVAKAAKKAKTPPVVPSNAPRIQRLSPEYQTEIDEEEAVDIESAKNIKSAAASAEEARHAWRMDKEAQSAVKPPALGVMAQRQEDLLRAEREAISRLHAERIEQQLQEQEEAEASERRRTHPEIKPAKLLDRLKGWLGMK